LTHHPEIFDPTINSLICIINWVNISANLIKDVVVEIAIDIVHRCPEDTLGYLLLSFEDAFDHASQIESVDSNIVDHSEKVILDAR